MAKSNQKENNSEDKKSEKKSEGIVLSIASQFGVLIGRVAYVLDVNKDAEESEKKKQVDEFLHHLGYDFSDDMIDSFIEIIEKVIVAAEGIEKTVSGLIELPWEEAIDKVIGNAEKAKTILEESKDDTEKDSVSKAIGETVGIAKDLYKNIKSLVEGIEKFRELESVDKLHNFLIESDFSNDFPRRFVDHIVVSVLRKVENNTLFDDKLDEKSDDKTDDNSKDNSDKKEALANTTFMKSLRIIIATLDLFEIFDKQEVEVLYQNEEEKTKAKEEKDKKEKDKEEKDKQEEGNEENENQNEKITSEIHLVNWGRFEYIFTFDWTFLKTIYPMDKMASYKKLFKRTVKLIDAIGRDELVDLLYLDNILEWLKSLIDKDENTDEKTKNEAKTKIDKFQKDYSEISIVKSSSKELAQKHKNDNKLQLNLKTGGGKELISFDKEDINTYLIQPIKRVLIREGVGKDIALTQDEFKNTFAKMQTLAKDRVETIKNRDLEDWFEYLKSAYTDNKLKINTSDFLETIENIKDFVLDDIVGIQEFKKILLTGIDNTLQVTEKYDKQRVKEIALAIGMEISTTFIGNYILPQLKAMLEPLNEYLEKLLILLFDLQKFYKAYENIKESVQILIDSNKNFSERINAVQGIVDEVIKNIPDELKNYLQKEFGDLIEIYNKIKENVGDKLEIDKEQHFVAISLYRYPNIKSKDKDKDKSTLSIKLCAHLYSLKQGENSTPTLDIFPRVKGSYDKEFELGDTHRMVVSMEGSIAEKKDDIIGLRFSAEKIGLVCSETATNGQMRFTFSRKEGKKALSLLDEKYIKISLGDYPQELLLAYSPQSESDQNNQYEIKYSASLKEAKIIITKKFFEDKVWDFIADMVKKDIVASFDTTLSVSTLHGFLFAGSPKISLELDVAKSFKNLSLDSVKLNLGADISSPSLPLDTSITTNLGLDFYGVSLTVSGLGFGLRKNLKTDNKFDFKNLIPDVIWPTGVGLGIDTKAVKGVGFIRYVKEESKFLGAIELSILEKIELAGLVVLNTKVEDVPGNFSFMCAMIVSGFRIPLGFGFFLTGMGGVLGLNRMIDTNVVQTGVYDGTLETAFMVKDLKKNITKIEKITNQYFPIKGEQFFFGALAKIDFGTPAIIKGELGVFLQFPHPTEIIIFGGLHVSMPENEPVVTIHTYFAGGINFLEGFWFDASIRDSNIGGIELFGDIAVRILWGNTKGILVSAGGFHPNYEVPAKYNIPTDFRRIGMKIDKGVFSLSLGAYFALTTNTVQFGARVDIKADMKAVKIEGYFAFDTLFYFSPFRFEMSIQAGVALSALGVNLLAVQLAFELSGTKPWRVKGVAKAKILFWTVGINFDTSWGDDAKEVEAAITQVLPVFIETWEENKNWKSLSDVVKEPSVQLYEIDSKELVIHPLQGFTFTQDRVPLNQKLDWYGKTKPGDFNKMGIKAENITIGNETNQNTNAGVKATTEQTLFIPADFIEMSNEDKLAAPSFVDMDSGFTFQSQEERNGHRGLINIDYNVDADTVFKDNTTYSVQDDITGDTILIADDIVNELLRDECFETIYNEANMSGVLFPATYQLDESVAGAGTESDAIFYSNVNKQRKDLIDKKSNRQSIFETTQRYKLYDKISNSFVKEIGSTYKDVLNKKNSMLKNKRRSTDLVIMAE